VIGQILNGLLNNKFLLHQNIVLMRMSLLEENDTVAKYSV